MASRVPRPAARGAEEAALRRALQRRARTRKKVYSYTRAHPFFPSRPREPSLPGQCERSDHRESTDTRQLIEVKPYRARLVLRWVTTLESRVALSFLFAIFGIFFAPLAHLRISTRFWCTLPHDTKMLACGLTLHVLRCVSGSLVASRRSTNAARPPSLAATSA